MDGQALATWVLAGLLAGRPPASDLAALHVGLAAAARTDARVGKVPEFYAARLAEPDRYLLAAVSLFARPVEPAAVLPVAAHEVFGSRLAGWIGRCSYLRQGPTPLSRSGQPQLSMRTVRPVGISQSSSMHRILICTRC